jgi:hypothetical protein
MTPFHLKFAELAAREMLVLNVVEDRLDVPLGQYGFVEFFCEEKGCDCRRVLLQVQSPQLPGRVGATINYGWETHEFYTAWMGGNAEAGQQITSASLDPIDPQSRFAPALLEAFHNFLAGAAS